MTGHCSLSCRIFHASDAYKKNYDAGVADTACSLETTRFYVAEIVQALEYMHSMVRWRLIQ